MFKCWFRPGHGNRGYRMLRKLLFCFAILFIAGSAAANDTNRAIADHTEAIRRDPKNANAYYNRGNAHSDKGDTDRAIADYTAAIRLDPTHANAHYNRGNAYSN